MSTILLILPNGASLREDESVLRTKLPHFARLAEESELFLIREAPESAVPEAEYLGFEPTQIRLSDGVLTVAALGVDPPDRSVHFHLSLLSVNADGVIGPTTQRPNHSDLKELLAAAERLNTPRLTLVPGEELDHGLVWEDGSIDMGTVAASNAFGNPVHKVLPEGDGEKMLRRYIDDSVELLGGLDINKRRVDQELPKLNLLWPWGQGFRERVPNLALNRGQAVRIESGSTRLAGLARLAGYLPGERAWHGNGLNVDLDRALASTRSTLPTVLLLDGLTSLRAHERLEEMAWLLAQVDQQLLAPLMRQIDAAHPMKLRLLLPGTRDRPASASPVGLALDYDSRYRQSNGIPFDERMLEERRLPVRTLWEACDEFLSSAALLS
ncbi:MAG: hypothetical protein JNM85_09615 [Chthonomonas sp.]|nr:hypothetical protein [Chthonomonas sp.]